MTEQEFNRIERLRQWAMRQATYCQQRAKRARWLETRLRNEGAAKAYQAIADKLKGL